MILSNRLQRKIAILKLQVIRRQTIVTTDIPTEMVCCIATGQRLILMPLYVTYLLENKLVPKKLSQDWNDTKYCKGNNNMRYERCATVFE